MLTIRQAEEKIALLSARAAQMEAHCRRVQHAARKLAPVKKYVEAVSELLGETAEGSGESLMRRMVTLQSTNEELKRQLSDAVDRLEQRRLESKARQRLHQSRFAPKVYNQEEPSPTSSTPKDAALPPARFLDVLQAKECLKQIGELARKYKAIIKDADAEREKTRRRGQRSALPWSLTKLFSSRSSPRVGPLETCKTATLVATSRSPSAARVAGSPGFVISKGDRSETAAGDSGRSSPQPPLVVRQPLSVEVEVPSVVAGEDVVEFVFIKMNGGNHRSRPQTCNTSTLSTSVYQTSVSGRQCTQGSQLHFGYSSQQQRLLHSPVGSVKTATLSHSSASDRIPLPSESGNMPGQRRVVVSHNKLSRTSWLTQKNNRKRSKSAEEASPGRNSSSRWAVTRTKAALQQQKKRDSAVSLPKILAPDSSAVERRKKQRNTTKTARPTLVQPTFGCIGADLGRPTVPRAGNGSVTLSQRVRFACDTPLRNSSFSPPGSSEPSRGEQRLRASDLTTKVSLGSGSTRPPSIQRFAACSDSISIARMRTKKTLGISYSNSCTELRNIKGFQAGQVRERIEAMV
ncbi:conserved hypothetical protein [Neospora caninum Liverpool]|uniref:Uncharacterized protein n=1 Tax=Neospora caninum (strain Liverpool) TaxID=572307 RepID=F0VE18_NEOCL|nr:conserved hypothetical protein [Neospora caninum Liverpool]CBZ51961.1 conserved hypothetical protein [Neospora caninum Liverpool]CEL65922.1 TPA: hypothetical protein BN1204_017530 [Neospora caninum Liverpool]|eukprot:XP_003881994.1 conserved hypothetical protein [Neospora caninum Liverpool]